MKDDLPQKNTFKYDIFFKCSVYTYRRRKKKKKKKKKKSKMTLSRKNTLQDDYQNTQINLCSFMETFIGVFIYCFPAKKKQET